MSKIICPNCKHEFIIDEASYAEIVRQVRDEQFAAELAQREKTVREIEALKSKTELEKTAAEGQLKISELKNRIKEMEKEAQIQKEKAEAEATRAKSVFEEELQKVRAQKDLELEKANSLIENAGIKQELAVKEAVAKAVDEKDRQLTEKQEKIDGLLMDINKKIRSRLSFGTHAGSRSKKRTR